MKCVPNSSDLEEEGVNTVNTGYGGIQEDENGKSPLTGNSKVEFKIDWGSQVECYNIMFE